MKIVIILGVLLAPLLVVAPVVLAQETVRGQVTNLPVPRFVSMKSGAANVRRGPSTSNRIDWELKHRGTPLRVLAEYREWFRVEDAEGEGGWVHSALLSSLRTVLVQQDMLALRDGPSEGAAALAHLEAGVIARLATCQPDWCSVSVEGYKGWLPRSGIWGVAAEE
ncbi:MAG: SH3 domain-containing protein [Rhodobacteraceae bacterium]|nr:SH3 domain-containing protein [Paracoccaceae bacterium]